MRLHTFIKNATTYTKSEVIKLQENNHILVNNKKEILSYPLKETDIVTIDGKVLTKRDYVYYLYNKPKGIICTNNLNIKDNFLEHINQKLDLKQKVFCVGRLDKDSSGLLILTNDGMFAYSILSKKSCVEKEYIVKLKEKITEQFMKGISQGITIKGKKCENSIVKKLSDDTISVILKEGKYHQIRRMVIYNKNRVVDLKRIRIANINLDCLKENTIVNVPDLKKIINNNMLSD